MTQDDAGSAQMLGSHVELHRAVRALLDGVNARYPDKNPRQWTCPHMQVLDDMTQEEPTPTLTEAEQLAVAWAVLNDDGDIAWIGNTQEAAADGSSGRAIVPLYRSPTLTDAEARALQFVLRHAAWACDQEAYHDSGDYKKHHDAVFRLMGR